MKGFYYNTSKRLFALILLDMSLFYFGCATTQDITLLDQRVASYAEKLDFQEEVLKSLKQKDSFVDEEMKKLKERLVDISTQLKHEQEQLITLEANLLDYHQLLDRSLKDNKSENEATIRRIERLEEISKSMYNRVMELNRGNNSVQNKIEPRNAWEELEEENFYNLALQTFKKGEYNTAREIFDAFLDKYPKGKLSDNATFWIGECYFKTNQYEQAILEYEKVKQNYPSGDKVPSAIFKQALSFLKLNIKDEAKIILKQLIEHYPQSEQAKMAKAQLEKLK